MAEQASGKDSVAPLAAQVDPTPLAIPSTPLAMTWPSVLREFWVAVPEGADRLVFRLPDRQVFRFPDRLVLRLLPGVGPASLLQCCATCW
jgi:hypothetical protein